MKHKTIIPIAALGVGLASTLLGACGASEPVCYDDSESIACVKSIDWSRYDAAVFGEVHYKEVRSWITVKLIEAGEDDQYVTELLPQLYDNGYEYLAVELDSSLQDEIESYAAGEMTRQEFIDATELFLVDEFGPLMDTAIELGMKVVAISEYPGYLEDPITTWDEREERTEANIAAIYESDPDAKVVVFHGAAHADKSEWRKMNDTDSYTGGGMTPLAYRLEHNLGLGTFSVSFSDTKGEFNLTIDLDN